jgi:glyoxylase-like metal-dependent hydrolase (beta-lactamase superfamily II)
MRIQTLKIRKNIDGNEVVLYPTVIQTIGKKYLVDSGYEETFDEFGAQLTRAGVKIDDLYAILVSHDDIDHVGALSLFKDKNPDLLIICSEIEAAVITGKAKSERLRQAEEALPLLAEEHQPWAINFINQLKNLKRVKVDKTLADQDIIDGEIKVVTTPGHTKGHISIYIPREKTLIANDALVLEEDAFNLANPQFTLDLPRAIKSVERIRQLDAETIICYHGGVTKGNISQRSTDLIERYQPKQ